MPRFNRKGTTKILFADTIASTTYLPTATELAGATDYTKQIAAVEGFSIENQEIETPDMDSTFVAKIPGDDQAADSSLTFYEDDTTDTIETDLAKGTIGFVIICRKGKTAAAKGMDVYPVRVASNSAEITADNEAAKLMVKFSIIDRPLLNATVPTGP
ncbi:phage tail tube protein [Streptomyces hygroscopicus]|uniref:phage tail tube protein n=1 Tax=Streptomyces hygroscopicus TaxID=1912 RepID=UPI0033C9C22D